MVTLKNALGYFFLLVFLIWGTSLYWIAPPAITPLEQIFINIGFSETATIVVTQGILVVSIAGFFIFLPDAPAWIVRLEKKVSPLRALVIGGVMFTVCIALFAYFYSLPLAIWLPLELIAGCLLAIVYLEYIGKGPSTWLKDHEE